jgi:hypothetical protein
MKELLPIIAKNYNCHRNELPGTAVKIVNLVGNEVGTSLDWD